MGKLIGRLRTGLAWHYVDSDGKSHCLALCLSGHHRTTQLNDVHGRTNEDICGACSWEDED